MIDKSQFHKYIPRIPDRYNSVKAFVVTIVLGVIILFSIGFFYIWMSDSSEKIEELAQPITYKGGYPEVHRAVRLFDTGKYMDAIRMTDSLMNADRDADLPELHKKAAAARNAGRDYELTWVKINSLVAMGHNGEAKQMLDTYVKTKGRYRKDAQALRTRMTADEQ